MPIDGRTPLASLSDDQWEEALSKVATPERFGGTPGPLAALDSQAVAARSLDMQQLTQGLGGPNVVSSFGPGLPLAPFHPEEEEPRRWDYPVGFNVQTRPRAYEPITFETLNALARNYDVANLAREKRIDDFRRLEWAIRPKRVEGEKRQDRLDRGSSLADAANKITGFFESPDQERQWGSWIYAYLDQVFVYDSGTLFMRYTKGGDLYGVEVIDGSTILPLIDLWGRLPQPPMAAYRQMIKGMPWTFHQRLVADNNVAFSTAQMAYDPFWTYAGSVYGHPPTERTLIAVNRALRRQTLDMAYFTDGSVPKSTLFTVPESWNNQQIGELQKVFDAIVAGNDAERQRLRFVPGGPGTGLLQVNPEPKPEVEEWLMMITCGAHGVSPMELGFTVKSSGLGGKGFAEEQAKSSNERNVALVRHVVGVINKIIAGPLKQPELEMSFPEIDEVEDSLQLAQRMREYWEMGVMSSDYIAEDVLDIDPPGLGPTVLSGNAIVPVSSIGQEPTIPTPTVPPTGVPLSPTSDRTGVDAGKPVDSPGAPSSMPGQSQVIKVRLDRLIQRSLERQYPPDLLGWVKDAQWRYDAHVLLSNIDMARRPGGRDRSNVNRIEDDISASDQVVPIVLVQTPGGGKLKIADGWHRTLAAQHAGKEFIPAYIGAVTEANGPWDRDMQQLQYRKAIQAEMTKWRRMAINAVRAGRPIRGFESAFAHDLPKIDLTKAATVADVQQAFEKAGASADPLVEPSASPNASSTISFRSGLDNRPMNFRDY